MKVLMVHNTYRQRGGEDAVFEAECRMLARAGHQVVKFCRSSSEIDSLSVLGRLLLPGQAIWSDSSYKTLTALLAREQPDIAHFHNTFPLISPSAYEACREAGIPVVQTLHNYRLFCPAATFQREGKACEECLQHSLWRSVRYACYHDSRLQTAAVAGMLAVHRARKTWLRNVDCFIVLSSFARSKCIAAGLPAEKIVVKPNFVDSDPGVRVGGGEYGLFVGRLATEKGVRTLLHALCKVSSVPFRIVGDGPLRQELERDAALYSLDAAAIMNHATPTQVIEHMMHARFLVFPSEWYEAFPLVIAEAYACGLSVIASRLGAMQELVLDNRTGLHFIPGDAEDLAEKIRWAWANPDAMEAMGREARALFESHYTAQQNCDELLTIYRGLLN